MAGRLTLQIPWVVLVAGLILTGTSYGVASAIEADRFETEFQAKVDRLELRIEERFAANSQVLLGGVGLWNVDPHVSRDDWRTYVESLQLDVNYPGIQGVGYALFIAPEDLDAHEAAIRGETPPSPELAPLFAEYTVHDVTGVRHDAEIYTSIIYLEPFDERNQNAFGLDMYSHPARRAAMDRAIETGEPALSGKVELVQEIGQDKQAGFLLYIPHYDPALPSDTPEQRREAILGFVYSPLRAGDLMQGILAEGSTDITFAIYDESVDQANLLFDAGGDGSGRQETRELVIAGRTWNIAYENTPTFQASQKEPVFVLVAGLLTTTLLFSMVWMQSQTQRRAEGLAIQMTAELRASEAEKSKLAANLKRSNEDLEQFAYIASHDLQEPVRTVGSFLDLLELEAKDLTREAKEYIHSAKRGVMRISKLITELLEYSRAGSEPSATPCDSNRAAATAIEELDAAIQESQADVMVDPLPAVRCRQAELSRIFQNLISNAIKYADGKPRIRIEATTDSPWVRFMVQDSGIGIASEHRESIFMMFKRLHRNDTHPGSGMGLAICKRIVDAYGGHMWVEAAPGGGSRFYWTLPMA